MITEYDKLISLMSAVKRDPVSPDVLERAYVLTGHNDYLGHLIKLFYADRSMFNDFNAALHGTLVALYEEGWSLSSNHVLAAFASSNSDNIWDFENLFHCVEQISTIRFRETCRVLKNKNTLQPIMNTILKRLDETILSLSHIYMLDQYFSKDLKKYLYVAPRLQLAVAARKDKRLSKEDRELLGLLELRWKNFVRNDSQTPALQAAKYLNHKPRVAVCISGQLRGYKEAWSKTARFYDYFNADRYVHVWDDVGRGMLVPDRADRWFEGRFLAEFRALHAEGKLTPRAFLERYPGFSEANSLVTATEVRDFYRTDHVVVEKDTLDVPTNHHRMFYKIWQCHEMMLASGIEYDLIIRVRPDLSFQANLPDWDAISLRARSEKTIWVETEFGINRKNGWSGDQFAFGSMDSLTAYSSVFPLERFQGMDALGTRIVQAHETLGFHLWKNGFIVPRAPLKNVRLCEVGTISGATLKAIISSRTFRLGRDDVHDRLLQAIE